MCAVICMCCSLPLVVVRCNECVAIACGYAVTFVSAIPPVVGYVVCGHPSEPGIIYRTRPQPVHLYRIPRSLICSISPLQIEQRMRLSDAVSMV